MFDGLQERLGTVFDRLKLSRRDVERSRRILLSIRKMVPGYRAKRFSRSELARRPYFPALRKVFAIHCSAVGRWAATLREWEAIAAEIEPEPEEETPRRRRGRGRGRQQDIGRGGDRGPRQGDGGGASRPRRRRGRRSGRSPTAADTGTSGSG